jgi:hypothetical protein
MSTIRGEVVLPKRVIQQPVPNVQPGGDCGACVIAGLTGLAVPEVYERFECWKRYFGETMEQALARREPTLGWHEMVSLLHQGLAHDAGFFDRTITDVAFWPCEIEMIMQYGRPSVNMALEWFAYLRMGLDAGYYAIANVDHGKKGGPADHWILIAGAREVWPEESGVIHQQLLVSCSSRSTPDEEWVNAHDFLKERGGFNLLFARPIK